VEIAMKLKDIIAHLNLEIIDNTVDVDKEIVYGYCSDMLSDVMGNAKEQSIWITLQIHQNIIGVAVMKEINAILMVNNRKPEADTVKKAKFQNVILLSTPLTAFEICGQLYSMGLKSS
jgi:hypothetical protein